MELLVVPVYVSKNLLTDVDDAQAVANLVGEWAYQLAHKATLERIHDTCT